MHSRYCYADKRPISSFEDQTWYIIFACGSMPLTKRIKRLGAIGTIDNTFEKDGATYYKIDVRVDVQTRNLITAGIDKNSTYLYHGI